MMIGAFCVAIVLWVWSTLFYVVSPVPYWTMSQTADDVAAGEALKEHFPETGTYILPGRYVDDDIRAQMRSSGPVATMVRPLSSARAESAKLLAIWRCRIGRVATRKRSDNEDDRHK